MFRSPSHPWGFLFLHFSNCYLNNFCPLLVFCHQNLTIKRNAFHNLEARNNWLQWHLLQNAWIFLFYESTQVREALTVNFEYFLLTMVERERSSEDASIRTDCDGCLLNEFSEAPTSNKHLIGRSQYSPFSHPW